MNNQKIEEFRIASKRTMASLGNDKLDLCHCLLGMVSELEEYVIAVDNHDVTNISEEIIDANFYVVNYMTMRNIVLADMDFDYDNYYTGFKIADSKSLYNSLVIDISKLSDLVKKYVAYNKEIDRAKEYRIITSIITCLYLLCKSHGIDMEKSMQNNVDKLLVRFPLEEGFSDNRATSRDLESERKELEK